MVFRSDDSLGTSPDKAPKPAIGSRVVVLEKVVFQAATDQPISADNKFCQFLKSDEQPYVRRMKVKPEEWQKLDHGWVGIASQLLIVNEAPSFQRIPTPEERASASACIVQLGIISPLGRGSPTVPFSQIRPGQSIRIDPTELSGLRVRCLSVNGCAITIYVYPL